MPNKVIKVFLVEDHAIMRLGIKSLLKSRDEIEIIGDAENGDEALKKIRMIEPDILLLDLNSTPTTNLKYIHRIKKEVPRLKILVISACNDEKSLVDAMEADAQGYILQNSRPDELIFAIQKIVNNGVYFGPEVTMKIFSKYKESNILRDKVNKDSKISDREMDVLNLVAEGLTNAEMAHHLCTSVRTIETRRKKLLDKTGTSNTATLIKHAVQHGLIK